MASSQRGVGGGDLADEAEIGLGLFLAGTEDVSVAAGEADCGLTVAAERGDKALVHAAGEHHEGGIAGFGVGDRGGRR